MSFDGVDFRAGQVLSATALAVLRNELQRLGRISIVAPLLLGDDPAGLRFAVGLPEVWQVKLTSGGTGGKYAWTRQIGNTAGTWASHPSGRTGTTAADPAYEMNGNTAVNLSPNPVVRAWRDPISRALVFESGSC
jgi:hypothetical protein